ncbi:26S proteasome subunit Usp14 [Acrasis kona]|uniref:Ubiquitin carboxyl-terminal hydrolase n=1 Tax=Acrasis kona TaxID=1008807 RepID=A0AAW2Z6H0_9EUKA
MVKVIVKWNKNVYKDIEIDDFKTGADLKKKLQELTNVPVDRQKVMGLGGLLKDDQILSDLKIKIGQTVQLLGSADSLPEPPKEKTVFAEDVTGNEESLGFYPNGLVNLGNTCYLNAAVQTLKVVPELRTALKEYTPPSSGNDLEQKITASLRDTFKDLDDNGKNSVTPDRFLQAFRSAYPQFAEKSRTEFGEIYAQQDADEFISKLLFSIGPKLQVTESSSSDQKKSITDKLFSGQFQVSIKNTESAEEPIKTEQEGFHKLSCYINQQTSNLNYGLEQSMQETIEKNSPTLNRNALYMKTSKISKLPPYLLVNFVRFEWKNRDKTKAKILRDVKFPTTLDVYDYCTDDYKKTLDVTREALRKQKEEAILKKKSDVVEPEEKKMKMDVDVQSVSLLEGDDTAWYELSAVITHKGRTSNSGHYVGWVKDDNKRWLKYDDDEVSEVSQEEVKKLSGGGDWHTAYLLLYKRMNEAP